MELHLLLIKFTLFDEFYLLDAKHIIAFWNRQILVDASRLRKEEKEEAWILIIMRYNLDWLYPCTRHGFIFSW